MFYENTVHFQFFFKDKEMMSVWVELFVSPKPACNSNLKCTIALLRQIPLYLITSSYPCITYRSFEVFQILQTRNITGK